MADDTTTDTGYTIGLEVEQSQYQDIMQAPILQENAVDDDATNGLCVLFDYSECLITWNINQVPTMQLTYPRDGRFKDYFKIQRIIIGDINRELTHQKFRITEIHPSDQSIIVNAVHIIGEYLTANPLKGTAIQGQNQTAAWTIDQILSNTSKEIPELNFDSDVNDVKAVNIDVTSTNALNALIDPDTQGDKAGNSVLAQFGGEFIFDNFTIHHRKHAGRDRKITIKYAGNVLNYQEDKSIAETYVGLYGYATYSPGAKQATEDNVDWNGIVASQDWSSIGSVTYNAGGFIDVYDSPVKGNKSIRQVAVGQHLKLGTPITDQSTIKDKTGVNVVVSTVNGHEWYPVSMEDGGGWIDATWINFDKTGDYVVNNAIGHVTVDSKADTALNRYPSSGTATVNYTQGSQLIHVYYSPDQGPEHYRRTDKNGKPLTYKNGQKIHYDYIAIDENGKKWYRIGDHKWLYGDHLATNKADNVQTYPSQGKGLVKKNAKKYKINTKTGKVEIEYKHLSLTQARKEHKKKYKTVYRGKGKNRKKVQIPNPDYQKGKAITHKNTYYSLNYGQVVVGGVLYYKLSNGSYVKASDIDKKARKTSVPTSPSKIEAEWADKNGKVEMYSAPTKGSAINWSIPDGQSFAVDKTAQGADGKTWYQVTYAGHTGWIPADSTSTTAPDDLEPQAVDPQDVDDSDSTAVVDQQTVTVELDDSFDNVHNGVYYPPDIDPGENTHIMKIDLSAYLTHDDQDQSGLQPDGTYQATAADKQQLLQLVMSAVDEYEIGKFPVSITANYADLSGEKDDLLALSLYDTVKVDFDGTVRKGEVTGTVWRMAGENSRYDSVQIGDPPKTWQHILLEQAKQDTTAQVARSASRTQGLLNQYDHMLAQEGSNRAAAEKDMMKQLGLISEKTDKNGKKIETQLVTNRDFEKKMNEIENKAQGMVDWVLGGGGGVIQAVPNWQNPTMLTATTDNEGSKMAFSSKGLVFYEPGGQQRERAGMTSDGKIYADQILGGTIDVVTIKALTINSSIDIKDPDSSMEIFIGTKQPYWSNLSPDAGGRVMWLTSNNYESMVSSGQMAVRNNYATDENGRSTVYQTQIRPSYISVKYDANHVLTMDNFASHIQSTVKRWVQDWVADYVTETGNKGHRLTIWKG
ncbi:MAG: endopeptidase [Lactobacillus kalixensis]|uniref:endopeptidase n=1 Tax=Lactobacillus kalixensis TaxID=227944 RepID=UPI003992232E